MPTPEQFAAEPERYQGSDPTQVPHTPELLPCPFCGAPAEEVITHNKSGWRVDCSRYCVSIAFRKTRDDAVFDWNFRPHLNSHSALLSRVRELEGALVLLWREHEDYHYEGCPTDGGASEELCNCFHGMVNKQVRAALSHGSEEGK